MLMDISKKLQIAWELCNWNDACDVIQTTYFRFSPRFRRRFLKIFCVIFKDAQSERAGFEFLSKKKKDGSMCVGGEI